MCYSPTQSILTLFSLFFSLLLHRKTHCRSCLYSIPIPLIEFFLKPLQSWFLPYFFTETTLIKVSNQLNMTKWEDQFSLHIFFELSSTLATVVYSHSFLKHFLSLTSRTFLGPSSASASLAASSQPPAYSYIPEWQVWQCPRLMLYSLFSTHALSVGEPI